MSNSTSLLKKLSLLGTSLSTLSLVALSLGSSSTPALGGDCTTSSQITTPCTLPLFPRGATFNIGSNNIHGTLISGPSHLSLASPWAATLHVVPWTRIFTATSSNTPYINVDIESYGSFVPSSKLEFINDGTIYITTTLPYHTPGIYTSILTSAETVLFTNNGTIDNTLNSYGGSSENYQLINIKSKNLTFKNAQTAEIKSHGNYADPSNSSNTAINILQTSGGSLSTIDNKGLIQASNRYSYLSLDNRAINITNPLGNTFTINNYGTISALGGAPNKAIYINNSGTFTINNWGSINASNFPEKVSTPSTDSNMALDLANSQNASFTLLNYATILAEGAASYDSNPYNSNVAIHMAGTSTSTYNIFNVGYGNISAQNGHKNRALELEGSATYTIHNWGTIQAKSTASDSENLAISASDSSSLDLTNHGTIKASGGTVHAAIAAPGSFRLDNYGTIVGGIYAHSTNEGSTNELILEGGSSVRGAIIGSGADSGDSLTIYSGSSNNPTSIITGYVPLSPGYPYKESQAVAEFNSLNFFGEVGSSYITFNAALEEQNVQQFSLTAKNVFFGNDTITTIQGDILASNLTIDTRATVELAAPFSFLVVRGDPAERTGGGTATIKGTLILDADTSGDYTAHAIEEWGTYTFTSSAHLKFNAASNQNGQVSITPLYLQGTGVYSRTHTLDASALRNIDIIIKNEDILNPNLQLGHDYKLLDGLSLNMLLPSFVTDQYQEFADYGYYLVYLKSANGVAYNSKYLFAHIEKTCNGVIVGACRFSRHVAPNADGTYDVSVDSNITDNQLIIAPLHTSDDNWKGSVTIDSGVELSATTPVDTPYIANVPITNPITNTEFATGSSLAFDNKGTIAVTGSVDSHFFGIIELAAENLNIKNSDSITGNSTSSIELMKLRSQDLTFVNSGTLSTVVDSNQNSGVYTTVDITQVTGQTTSNTSSSFTNNGTIEALVNSDASDTALGMSAVQVMSAVSIYNSSLNSNNRQYTFTNTGTIKASGGKYNNAASIDSGPYFHLVNAGGEISATGSGAKNKSITITGAAYGTIANTGTISASGGSNNIALELSSILLSSNITITNDETGTISATGADNNNVAMSINLNSFTLDNYGKIIGDIKIRSSAIHNSPVNSITFESGSSLEGNISSTQSLRNSLSIYGGPSQSGQTTLSTGLVPNASTPYGDHVIYGFSTLDFSREQYSSQPSYISYNATVPDANTLTATTVGFNAHTNTDVQGVIAAKNFTVAQDAKVTLEPYSFLGVHGGTANIYGSIVMNATASTVPMTSSNLGVQSGSYVMSQTARLIYKAAVDDYHNLHINPLVFAQGLSVDLSQLQNIDVLISGDLSDAIYGQEYKLVDASATSVDLPAYLTTTYEDIKTHEGYTYQLKKDSNAIWTRIIRATSYCGATITGTCQLSANPSGDYSMTIDTNLDINGALITSPTHGFVTGWQANLTIASGVQLNPTLAAQETYIAANIKNNGQLVSGSEFHFYNNGVINITANGSATQNTGNAIEVAASSVVFNNGNDITGTLTNNTNSGSDISLVDITATTLSFLNNEGRNLALTVKTNPKSNPHIAVNIKHMAVANAHADFKNFGTIKIVNPHGYNIAVNIVNWSSSFGNLVAINAKTGTIEATGDGYNKALYTRAENTQLSNAGTISTQGYYFNTTLEISNADSATVNNDGEISATSGVNTAILIDSNSKNTLNITNNGVISATNGYSNNAILLKGSAPKDVKLGKGSTTQGSIIGSGDDVGMNQAQDTLTISLGTNDSGHNTEVTGQYIEGFNSLSFTQEGSAIDATFNYHASYRPGKMTAHNLSVAKGVTVDVAANAGLNINGTIFNGGAVINGPYASLFFSGDVTLAKGSILDANKGGHIALTGTSVMRMENPALASVETLSIESGATLEGAGTLSITSPDTFAGTLHPMSVGGARVLTLDLGGTLKATPEARITTTLNDSGTTPALNVTGGVLDLSAMSQKNLGFGLTPTMLYRLATDNNSARFALISADKGGVILMPTLDGEQATDKLLYRFTLEKSQNGQGFEAVLVAKNGGKLAKVESFSKNNKALGAFFDHLSDSDSTLDAIHNTLINATTAHDAIAILDQMQPQVYGGLTQEVGDVSQRFATLTMHQIQSDLVDLDTHWHVTASPLFNTTQRGAYDGQFKTKSWDAGLNVTLSKRVIKDLTVGGSFQYDHTKLEVGDVDQSAKSENISIGAFVGYKKKGLFASRPEDHVYAQGALAYSAGIGSVNRSTVASSPASGITNFTEESYSSKPMINVIRFTAQGEYGFKVPYGLEVGPYARLDVGWMGQGAEDEKGNVASSFHVKSSSYALANLTIGGALHWNLRKMKSLSTASDDKSVSAQLLNNVTADVNLGWVGNLASQSRNVEYTFGGNKTVHKLHAHDAPGLGGAVWGVGLTSRIGSETFSVRYDGSFGAPGTQVSNAVSLTVGMAF